MKQLLMTMVLTMASAVAIGQTVPATQAGDAELGARARLRRGFVAAPQQPSLEEVATFMREHAPNRWGTIQSLPDDGAVRQNVMGFVIARYQALQEQKRLDPQLYDISLQRLTQEDELYGMAANFKTRDAREDHREAFREAVAKLLDLNLAEREHRIARMKRDLEAEETRLANDRERLPKQLDARVDQVITEGVGALRRDIFATMRRDINRPGRATTQPTK